MRSTVGDERIEPRGSRRRSHRTLGVAGPERHVRAILVGHRLLMGHGAPACSAVAPQSSHSGPAQGTRGESQSGGAASEGVAPSPASASLVLLAPSDVSAPSVMNTPSSGGGCSLERLWSSVLAPQENTAQPATSATDATAHRPRLMRNRVLCFRRRIKPASPARAFRLARTGVRTVETVAVTLRVLRRCAVRRPFVFRGQFAADVLMKAACSRRCPDGLSASLESRFDSIALTRPMPPWTRRASCKGFP
jgi:hypothetical protein